MGLIAGGVYIGNRMSRAAEEKKMQDAMSRVLYGGTKEELQDKQECVKKRTAYLKKALEPAYKKNDDEFMAAKTALNQRGASEAEIDKVVNKWTSTANGITDGINENPNWLVREGYIKSIPPEYECR